MAAFASPDELENYLDGDPLPRHPERLLDRASDRVRECLIGLAYDPADVDVIAALKDATILQAQWMAPDETGAREQYQSMSTGGVSWTRAQDGKGRARSARYSPDMLAKLRTSGHFGTLAIVVGG